MNRKEFLEELIKEYSSKNPKSEKIFRSASQKQIRGGSHNLRLFPPFPIYAKKCKGSKVWDADGNAYIDFWQGHFANVLGHNPKAVMDKLRHFLKKGQGLETGFPEQYQRKLAELILSRTKADKIRFTTSGTLSSMYAIMLAKAYTQREKVLKVGGGWHGAHPYALKGISTYKDGLNQSESAGLPPSADSMVLVTRFNDLQDLEKVFRQYGKQIACFIIEPFIGAGGFIFASQDYLQKARELTETYGTVLIFDEVVSGFRFHAGPLQNLYSIKPDLTVYGKAIGGGMPVSAVAGSEDLLSLCNPETPMEQRVKFEGGTFSGHPLSMLSGITYIQHLIDHEAEIYPKIGKWGAEVRIGIREIFSSYGFNVKTTGDGYSIAPDSSLIGVQFLKKPMDEVTSPEQVWDPEVSDVELREAAFKLAMMAEGFNTFHGFGAISASHSPDEIQASLEAVGKIAQKWSQYHIQDDLKIKG
ncbi:MAG: aminotransferase class III-fold pyridoxal phosphate-dependent enzyme [Candidatus Aminicenantes bacterium]|nr:aminotransferase class III-fold pyridoxal phosphate-dependent enzyme [Candidatus Aminicenantes bacterium]